MRAAISTLDRRGTGVSEPGYSLSWFRGDLGGEILILKYGVLRIQRAAGEQSCTQACQHLGRLLEPIMDRRRSI